jgi:hypothetical protein
MSGSASGQNYDGAWVILSYQERRASMDAPRRDSFERSMGRRGCRRPG